MFLRRLPTAVSAALLPLTRRCVYDATGRLRPLYRFRTRWRSPRDREEIPVEAYQRLVERLVAPWPEGLDRDLVMRAMLLEGRCPSCAYLLPGPPESDEAVAVCSECGGIWWQPRD